MSRTIHCTLRSSILLCWLLASVASAQTTIGMSSTEARAAAAAILKAAESRPGLTVHIACGDGALTQALGQATGYIVHGIDEDADLVSRARERITTAGIYGRVAVDVWDGGELPYAAGTVTMVVTDALEPVLEAKAMRVLAPLGCLVSRDGQTWTARTKPWPEDIDEWTHYLHDPGNNAVAQDTRIGPPDSVQWVGSPRWSRHHDRLPSLSALVSAGNRIFYIFDEGPTASIALPSSWTLIARDAFNGTVLWKRPIPEWQTRFWPLKSGPAQLPRRLVATRERVFVTLGVDVPLTALDASDGRVLREYSGTRSTVEVLHSDGVLYLLVDPDLDREKYTTARRVNTPWWSGGTQQIQAVEAASGRILWKHDSSVAPLSLAYRGGRVLFHDGESVVCLSASDGHVAWRSEPVPLVKRVMSFFAPTLVVRDGVVLFAGGEESGLVKSTGGATKSDTLTALDAVSGRKLWSTDHPPSGYSSPEDLFVIDNTVWFAGTSNGRLPGEVKGVDLRTGEVRVHHTAADVDTYWFHHRCYRGKATTRYLMVSRTGIEFIEPESGHWDINHWTRGGCMYGIMPANGLIYTPPNDCACYPEAKISGFNALAARDSQPDREASDQRLLRGPAYAWRQTVTAAAAAAEDWPTYRGDMSRHGTSTTQVPAALEALWSTAVGQSLSAVTVADGRVFAADIDQHALVALDASSGDLLWRFTAGGRIDSPPTVHAETVIFGCRDGRVTCLRATDGQLVWQRRAAPADERIMAFEQLESRWPIHGSVLVADDVVYALAGRSLFLDGGMRLCRLDAASGQELSETVLNHIDPDTADDVHTHVKRLTMPVALPDVLSSDGTHVYMRSQVFGMDGIRQTIAPLDATQRGAHAAVQEGPTRHLFSSAGFLDGSWFHRSYWLYGRHFEGGWNSYYLAGKRVPAGKILSIGEDRVFGFGRQPRYFRWTTPMEYHLFAVPKESQELARKPKPDPGTVVRVANADAIDPSGKALLVSAWARTEKPNGVVVAHGGGVMGYSLYLQDGKARFAVTNASKRTVVSGQEALPSGWVHLAGLLDPNARMLLYVNGRQVAEGNAPALISKNPANAMQVGADEQSPVGQYSDGFPFKGLIDEVRVYHGPFTPAGVQTLARGGKLELAPGQKLVLHLTFDGAKATDASGAKNHGQVVGAVPVEGRLGGALRFSGILPDAPAPTTFDYAWTTDAPILVRGMVATANRLFVAGPQDILDEPEAINRADEPDTMALMARQLALLDGAEGGTLLAIDPNSGAVQRSIDMSGIPVWDGLAAAQGRLYIACTDGTIRCFGAGAQR